MTKTATPRRVNPGTSATLLGAVLNEVESLRDRVDGHDRVLAPAFTAPKERESTVPMSPTMSIGPGAAPVEPYHVRNSSSGGMEWHKFPDHDADYLAGRISLDQAIARHMRPDEGCQCVNCARDRKRVVHQHQPEPERRPRCPSCGGNGRRDVIGLGLSGLDWTPCTACNAVEFFRLQGEAYNVRSQTGACP
jgi:hypothetical protein